MSATVTLGGKPITFVPAQVSCALSAAAESLRLGLRKSVTTSYDWILTAEWTCLSSAVDGDDYDPFAEVKLHGDMTPCVLVTLSFSPRLDQNAREGIYILVDNWCSAMVRSSYLRATGPVECDGVEQERGESIDTLVGNKVRFWWPVEGVR